MTATANGGDLLITDIGQLVDPGEGAFSAPLEVVGDAFVWIRQGRIAATGAMVDLPSDAAGIPSLDADGWVALPGLVDSHTHAVFGATREHEFEQRLAGASYAEIADLGGGIGFSVRDLRARSEDDLVLLSRPRLAAAAHFGVTTVEVKSGYGLDTEQELKMLRVVARLATEPKLPRLVPTFLGAHALPVEFANDRAAFVRLVVDEMLPAVATEALAEFCDVFCDRGAFRRDEAETILRRAAELGFGLKMHADEFESLGGTQLAVELGATSVDHLVAVDEAGIAALAGSDTVATLLPGTSFFLRLDRHAPARELADRGANLALATDFNPGTSMTQNLLLMVTFGCCSLGLAIGEALRAVTRGGALALRRSDLGTLMPGARGDVALFQVPDYRHLAYHYGMNHCAATIKSGEVIWRQNETGSRFPT